MEDKKKDIPQNINIISEAVVLAVIPVIAYALTFSYVSRYLSYFGVPSQYINLNLSELFLFISGFFVFLSLAYPNLNIIYILTNLFTNNTAKKKFLIFVYYSVYLFVLSFLYLTLNKKIVAIITSIIGGCFLFYVFVFPLFKKSKDTYELKLEKNLINIRDPSKIETIETGILKIIGPNVFDFLIFGIVFFGTILYMINLSGEVKAYQQQEFDVIKTTPECAIIYTRSDFLICTIFDKNKHEFEQGYQIFRNEDLKGIRIIKENIGPLHLKPTPTPTPKPTLTPTITNTPSPTNSPTLDISTLDPNPDP